MKTKKPGKWKDKYPILLRLPTITGIKPPYEGHKGSMILKMTGYTFYDGHRVERPGYLLRINGRDRHILLYQEVQAEKKYIIIDTIQSVDVQLRALDKIRGQTKKPTIHNAELLLAKFIHDHAKEIKEGKITILMRKQLPTMRTQVGEELRTNTIYGPLIDRFFKREPKKVALEIGLIQVFSRKETVEAYELSLEKERVKYLLG